MYNIIELHMQHTAQCASAFTWWLILHCISHQVKAKVYCKSGALLRINPRSLHLSGVYSSYECPCPVLYRKIPGSINTISLTHKNIMPV
jgi:hypothetical protein